MADFLSVSKKNPGTSFSVQGGGIEAFRVQLRAIIENDRELKAAILDNPKYAERLLQENIIDELKADIAREKALLRYDWESEAGTFLSSCEIKSRCTAKAYRYALADYKAYTEARGKAPLALSAELADSYILDLQKRGKAPATVRQYYGGLSSFFNALERKSEGKVKNYFHGCRTLPKRKPIKKIEAELPTENLKLFRKDVNTIIASEQDPTLKAIMSLMAFRGLRAGSFQNMSFHGGKFFTTSKGKDISGELPEACSEALQGLPCKLPFAAWTGAKVSSAFQYRANKLFASGKIAYKYSAHDLRHFFALTEYDRTKDIYRLQKLLGHTSIAITEVYLRGMNVAL